MSSYSRKDGSFLNTEFLWQVNAIKAEVQLLGSSEWLFTVAQEFNHFLSITSKKFQDQPSAASPNPSSVVSEQGQDDTDKEGDTWSYHIKTFREFSGVAGDLSKYLSDFSIIDYQYGELEVSGFADFLNVSTDIHR